MDPDYQEVFGDYDEPEAEETGGEDPAAGGKEQGEPAGESGAAESGEGGEPAAPAIQAPNHVPSRTMARSMAQAPSFDQTQIDKIYADMFSGQTNPYTGKPITSEAEFRAFQTAQAQKTQEDALKESGIQPDLLARMVDSRVAQHPAIAAARQAAEAARAQAAHAAEAEANEAIRTELSKISAIDPGVKTLEDIGRMPTAEAFNRYVRQGVPLEDAFWLANRKELEQKRLAAARQTTINQTRSKEGLNSGAGGGVGISVPADQAAAYREVFPDATDTEIQKNWVEFQKSCS